MSEENQVTNYNPRPYSAMFTICDDLNIGVQETMMNVGLSYCFALILSLIVLLCPVSSLST